jgi:Dual-action HEIGH metallo-peptidase
MLAAVIRPGPALLAVLFAPTLTAITFVVPADRFEIERSSAIVVGRVLRSHVDGLETVTDVAVEEAIKGGPGFLVQVHVPDGVLGAPSFADGERVLVFLYRRGDGSFAVNDLQLGAFHFVEGLLLRDEAELVGWDPDGQVHEERPRSAERFLDYVRGVARGEAASDAYFVSVANAKVVKATNAAFTATSYTLQYAGGVGSRWNVFPAAVNWNQGNSESGALGSGTPQINAAFSAWNAGGAHYVLAGATPNTKGFLDATDGVNNIVFEKDLTAAGIQPFSCTNGGALGMGGMHKAGFGAAAHVFHGETFATTLEADVSMNQGLANCTTGQLAPGEFASVITHELGHTLGFRHSDQNRLVNAPCSTDPTLECNSQAIMNHILVSGLNGHLQTWDKTALDAVYGSVPASCPAVTPGTPHAAAASGGVQLSINATGGSSFTFKWFEGAASGSGTPIGTGNPLVVNPAQPTRYWCRITNQCGNSADSAVVSVTPCVAPRIVEQPQDRQAFAGTTVPLIVGISDPSASVAWFEGASGDTSAPVGSGLAIASPVLTQTTRFWARVTGPCGSADSDAATITVKIARRRSARH